MVSAVYRAAVEAGLIEQATYRQQLIACGKRNCRTCGGRARKHGPYWYAEWEERTKRGAAKTRTKYVGRRLPEAIARYVAQTGTRDGRAAAAAELG